MCGQIGKVRLDQHYVYSMSNVYLFRFMRGERDPNPTIGVNSFRGNCTPSTPSTASTTVRQNPLSYQRMHSNDSDKETPNGGNTSTGSGGGSVTNGGSTGGSGRVSD